MKNSKIFKTISWLCHSLPILWIVRIFLVAEFIFSILLVETMAVFGTIFGLMYGAAQLHAAFSIFVKGISLTIAGMYLTFMGSLTVIALRATWKLERALKGKNDEEIIDFFSSLLSMGKKLIGRELRKKKKKFGVIAGTVLGIFPGFVAYGKILWNVDTMETKTRETSKSQ